MNRTERGFERGKIPAGKGNPGTVKQIVESRKRMSLQRKEQVGDPDGKEQWREK